MVKKMYLDIIYMLERGVVSKAARWILLWYKVESWIGDFIQAHKGDPRTTARL